MPLLKQWNIGTSGTAAIWQVEEPELFFAEHTGLSPYIKNDRRRTEHLASRFLLRHIMPQFPLHLITKDHTNKPYLSNQLCFFSISHSWPYIAVIIDTLHETGIDIQTYHPRITDIRHKFLSPTEQTLIGDDPQLITLAWCAKESVYKWYGSRKVDFIAHLPITSFDLSTPDINMSINFNINDLTNKILLHNLITTDFACSYISAISM